MSESDFELRAKVCAQLLGSPYHGPERNGWHEQPRHYAIEGLADGCIRVTHWPSARTSDDHNRTVWTVDLPTLEVAALLRDAGDLDVGPCSECDGSRHWIERGPFVDPAMVARGRREGLRLVSHGHGLPDDLAHLPQNATVLLDGCKACAKAVVDPHSFFFGKMRGTGREIVPAWRAVLMAAQRAKSRAFEAASGDQSHAEALAAAANPGRDVRSRFLGDGWQAWALLDEGHEGAREALRHLTEELEACSVEGMRDGRVAADIGLSRGVPRADLLAFDGPEHDRWSHPCPDLGAWVLAWLAGECKPCNGRGEHPDVMFADPCSWCARTGLAIGPHLSNIEAHLRAAWERETVECGACEFYGVDPVDTERRCRGER